MRYHAGMPIKRKPTRKLPSDRETLGVYGAPPVDEVNRLSVQMEQAAIKLRQEHQCSVLTVTVFPDGSADTLATIEPEQFDQVIELADEMADKVRDMETWADGQPARPARLRAELDRAIELLRQDPTATELVAGMLREAVEEENGPVPIYAGPAAAIAVAYAGPEVYRPTERVKQWNRDHDQHPFRENYLVRQLSNQGIPAEQIDLVLDVLDDICTSCWDAPAKCQCWNDR